jgi:hypothetical protein
MSEFLSAIEKANAFEHSNSCITGDEEDENENIESVIDLNKEKGQGQGEVVFNVPTAVNIKEDSASITNSYRSMIVNKEPIKNNQPPATTNTNDNDNNTNNKSNEKENEKENENELNACQSWERPRIGLNWEWNDGYNHPYDQKNTVENYRLGIQLFAPQTLGLTNSSGTFHLIDIQLFLSKKKEKEKEKELLDLLHFSCAQIKPGHFFAVSVFTETGQVIDVVPLQLQNMTQTAHESSFQTFMETLRTQYGVVKNPSTTSTTSATATTTTSTTHPTIKDTTEKKTVIQSSLAMAHKTIESQLIQKLSNQSSLAMALKTIESQLIQKLSNTSVLTKKILLVLSNEICNDSEHINHHLHITLNSIKENEIDLWPVILSKTEKEKEKDKIGPLMLLLNDLLKESGSMSPFYFSFDNQKIKNKKLLHDAIISIHSYSITRVTLELEIEPGNVLLINSRGGGHLIWDTATRHKVALYWPWILCRNDSHCSCLISITKGPLLLKVRWFNGTTYKTYKESVRIPEPSLRSTVGFHMRPYNLHYGYSAQRAHVSQALRSYCAEYDNNKTKIMIDSILKNLKTFQKEFIKTYELHSHVNVIGYQNEDEDEDEEDDDKGNHYKRILYLLQKTITDLSENIHVIKNNNTLSIHGDDIQLLKGLLLQWARHFTVDLTIL